MVCYHLISVIQADTCYLYSALSLSLSLSLSPLPPVFFSFKFRAKLYKLQHPGKELIFSDMKPPVIESEQQGRSTSSHQSTSHHVSILASVGQMDMSTVTQQKEESRKILRE